MPSSNFNQANAHWRAGRWEAALADYDAALAQVSDFAPAHLGRARCLVQLGQFNLAREAFTDSLRLDPSQYSGWLEAGHLCRRNGELQLAAAAYQRAIDLDGSRHEALLAMARVLHALGQSQLWLDAFGHALEAAREQGAAQNKPLLVVQSAHRMGQ